MATFFITFMVDLSEPNRYHGSLAYLSYFAFIIICIIGLLDVMKKDVGPPLEPPLSPP